MEANQATVSSETPAVSLNLVDLRSFCQIIEVCTTRGAFRADELASVGALYDKTMAFLKQSGAVAPAKEAEPVTEAESK